MKRILALLLITAFSFSAVYAQAEIPADIKDHIKERVDKGIHAGIVVAYINGDEVSYFNYGKTKRGGVDKVDEYSVFEIGSISKVFTTILLANQIVNGKMALSDPISKYLPENVKVPLRAEKEITLKDLATHSSGLPRMPSNFNPENPANPFADYTIAQVYDFISTHELSRDIGETYEYSNYGMGLLGHLLELQTEKTYEALMIENIADAYDMKDTRITLSSSMKEHLATGHAAGKAVENWDIVSLAGAGGIRSTAVDMVKFIQANMSNKNTPLSKAMKMTHNTAYTNQNFEIGLGWHYAKNNDKKVIWHNGGTGGYRSFAGFVEGTQKGVVVLTNSNVGVDDIALKMLFESSVPLNLPQKDDEEFPEEVEVADAILESYVGVYQLAPTFSVTVSKQEKQLFIQATGQQKIEVYPSSPTEFFLKVVKASISFNKNEEGVVESLTLHQNGQHVPGKKVE